MTIVDTWKIRIANYGTFEFEGTEEEAEQRCVAKARWEGSPGVKWRVTNQTEADKIREEMAAIWDSGEGVSPALMRRLRKATAV